ncbi:MAG: hypothetical protein MZV65_52365 [Chromatiales bacterium]|nr:hypothetical protein [Chromatiales bacterium]
MVDAGPGGTIEHSPCGLPLFHDPTATAGGLISAGRSRSLSAPATATAPPAWAASTPPDLAHPAEHLRRRAHARAAAGAHALRGYEPFTVAGDEARNIETRVQGIMNAGKRALGRPGRSSASTDAQMPLPSAICS